MRIGFDAKRFFNNLTGLGNYSRFIVNALTEKFPDNEYLLYTPKLRRHSEIESITKKSSISVHTPSRLVSSLGMGSLWRSFRLGDVAASDEVQLFHGLSNELPFLKPRSLKTIVTVHDLIFERFPQFYNSFDIQIYSWKLKVACQSADKIIAISKQTEEDLVEFLNIDRAKIKVVYQGCHPNFKCEYSDETLREVRVRYNLPEEFILNVGTVESRKNVMVLVQALGSMRGDVPIVIVGRKTPYLNQLMEYISAHRLGKRVLFIHDAKFLDLPLIYRMAKVFVYPSLFEGFGIPIVEAISCGVPVITSQGSCFSEAGGPDCSYIDPQNPEQLAATLDALLSNESLRRQMTEKSKSYIERFEPRVIATDLMRIYKEVL